MGQFSVALRSAMSSVGWDQNRLAQETKAVSQSRLSKYLIRGELPKVGTFEQICRVFEPRIREELTQAYLTDQIPPSARELVAVTSVKEGAAGPKFRPGRAPEGSILRADLDFLEREAMDDSNLARVLNYLAASRRGVRPHPDYFEPEQGDGYSVMEDPLVVAARLKIKEEQGTFNPKRSTKSKRKP